MVFSVKMTQKTGFGNQERRVLIPYSLPVGYVIPEQVFCIWISFSVKEGIVLICCATFSKGALGEKLS